MGYVFKDRSGPWAIAFKDANGRLRRERLEVSTRALARRVLAARLDDVERAKLQGLDTVDGLKPAPAPSLRVFAEKTYLPHVKATRGARTLEAYTRTFEKFVFGALGHKPLTEVSPADIQKFTDDRRHAGKAPATVRREWAALSGLFALAVQHGKLERNPCRGVRLARVEQTVGRCLTEKEESSLLAHASRDWREILTFLLETAMRDGEVRNLKWSDCDLQAGVVTIRGTKAGRDRVIPLSAPAAAVLADVPKGVKDPYVFRSRVTGRPYLKTKLSELREWDDLKARAGVECRIHDMRHTCLTRMSRGGAPLKAVQAFAGHANIGQTARYAHVSGLEDLRACVAALRKNGVNTTHPATQTEKAASGGA